MKILTQMGTGAYKNWHLYRLILNPKTAVKGGDHNILLTGTGRDLNVVAECNFLKCGINVAVRETRVGRACIR